MADWRPGLVSDTTLADSNKTLTVPANRMWHILGLRAELTSTASAGNRQLNVHLLDTDAAIIQEFRAGLVQAASATYYYTFAPGMDDKTAVRDSDWLSTPIPPTLVLTQGQAVKVLDNSSIAADSDTLILRLSVMQKGDSRNFQAT